MDIPLAYPVPPANIAETQQTPVASQVFKCTILHLLILIPLILDASAIAPFDLVTYTLVVL